MRRSASRSLTGFRSATSLPIERFAKLHGDFRKLISFGAYMRCIVTSCGCLEFWHSGFDSLAVRFRNLVAEFRKRLLGRMNHRLGLVLSFDQLAALLVGGCLCLGVLEHP